MAPARQSRAAGARRPAGLGCRRRQSLSPPQLISAILAAPVDLLWFGGIGTFVKAPDEPDSEVGDHANDAVRITSDDVRARVIAEGGNLGVTQRARIRYSRRGGRINTDFIDNAAGVATSDREVNLKILLALAIERGRLDPSERDAYLAESADEVAGEVLRQVDHSVAALSRAVPGSARELDAYEALMDDPGGGGPHGPGRRGPARRRGAASPSGGGRRPHPPGAGRAAGLRQVGSGGRNRSLRRGWPIRRCWMRWSRISRVRSASRSRI